MTSKSMSSSSLGIVVAFTRPSLSALVVLYAFNTFVGDDGENGVISYPRFKSRPVD